MAVSEIFIITDTGVILASKKYRDDIKLQSALEFTRQWKQHTNKLQPCFVHHDVQFFYIKRHRVFFVATSSQSSDPVYCIELLSRLHNLCQDMFGIVDEESIQKNFILLHEILDEFIDYGFVQVTSTDKMKPYIQSNPVLSKSPEHLSSGLFGAEHHMVGSQASNKPVIKSKSDQEERQHNEIFIDVVEHIAATVDSKGMAIQCEVQGSIDMKCFLIGTPEVRIGFSESLILDKQDIKGFGEQIFIDDFKFHNSVRTDHLQRDHAISLHPPEGRFSLMTYRIKKDLVHGLPFRLYSYINKSDSKKDLEVGLKLRCETPVNCKAAKVVVQLPVPKSVTSVSQQLGGPEQTAEFKAKESLISWKISKMEGKAEESCHFNLISSHGHSEHCELELGPVLVDFEISGFLCSNLQVRSVKVVDSTQSSTPKRWVRYITTPDSYVIKLH